MTKYPIGIQTFSKIIEDGYVYIDKTALIHQLISNGGYYFLSRPRRFCKSLLISTLEAFFLGKKELFKGLAIEQLETEWKQYPVFHLDLNTGLYNAPPALDERLSHHLKGWEDLYGIVPTDSQSLATRFEVAIKRAYEQTGMKVVILVDEYDKPLLQSLGNKELQETYRAMLKSFYGVAKSMDAYIQFAFFTGVTKISVDSLLGDLNNITNISLDKRFTGICGFTEEEIRNNFDTRVELMAMKNHLTKEDCYAKLKENIKEYDERFQTYQLGIPNHEIKRGIYRLTTQTI